jgi:endonuclease-3 related protein
MPSAASILREIYDALLTRFGHQEWWPAESAFEVMVGAVLAQNTNWKNVEKAIANLKREDLLEPLALDRLGPCRLARLIRPAGCYNVKAQRLANLVRTLVDECGGDLDVFFSGQR